MTMYLAITNLEHSDPTSDISKGQTSQSTRANPNIRHSSKNEP